MALKNKVLLFMSYKKRTRQGPGRVLCKQAEENRNHLLVSCPYIKYVRLESNIYFSGDHS